MVTAEFSKLWPAPKLPGYRVAEGTYHGFDYDGLPPIPLAIDGKLSWLTPMDDHTRKAMQPYWDDSRDRSKIAAQFEKRVADAAQMGFKLPDVFLRFMRSPVLQERIPSCTACYFDAPERIVFAPSPGSGILFRFLNDQQWCILWYLYVEPNGDHAVLASDCAFDVEDADEMPDNPLICFCAPDFETFLFRFWLENSAGFALYNKHRPLTAEESAYLHHYRQ